MYSLIIQLAEEKVCGHYIANYKVEEVREMIEGIDFKALSSGSTYVPMDVAMKVISDMKANNNQAIVKEIKLRNFESNGNPVFIHVRLTKVLEVGIQLSQGSIS